MGLGIRWFGYVELMMMMGMRSGFMTDDGYEIWIYDRCWIWSRELAWVFCFWNF